MENTVIKTSVDLQKFIDKFKPDKFKLLTKGIEIRGIVDLHGDIKEANEIIRAMGLKLKVIHNAEMLTRRGFEVNNL